MLDNHTIYCLDLRMSTPISLCRPWVAWFAVSLVSCAANEHGPADLQCVSEVPRYLSYTLTEGDTLEGHPLPTPELSEVSLVYGTEPTLDTIHLVFDEPQRMNVFRITVARVTEFTQKSTKYFVAKSPSEDVNQVTLLSTYDPRFRPIDEFSATAIGEMPFRIRGVGKPGYCEKVPFDTE